VPLLEGEIGLEFKDGRKVVLRSGISFKCSVDEKNPHRAGEFVSFGSSDSGQRASTKLRMR